MRKKALLKMVSLCACFSILMLSVPGVIAADKAPKKSFYRLLDRSMDTLNLLLPFFIMKVNDKNNTSVQSSDDDSDQKIKSTGGKLVKKVVGDK